ncbi:MAG: class I SAM-dependent methyltransferase [Candidatus Magnetominusculus sp. LBB02]|nr:class I SAM-dependent methyltransferase [Candidatus Magnetominusculus sp. LBB02]
MSLYCEHFFPWFMEQTGKSSNELVKTLRRGALAGMGGSVLEVGFGIGHNLPYYPAEVAAVTALEPNEGMIGRARRYVSEAALPVSFVKGRAEALPFEDNSFDAVVSTMTLCSVSNLDEALKEIYRVIRPGGAFHFLEHVAASNPIDRGVQNLLSPVTRTIFCGCNLNRDIESAMVCAGFHIKTINRDRQRIGIMPQFLTYFIYGRAAKAKPY